MSTQSLHKGFMVLHSNRMEQLVNLLAEFVVQYPLHPLEKETLIIQSNGMADWLNLQLAETSSLGISAAVDSKMPSTFLWHLYRLVLGAEAVPLHSPFEKNRLLWRLYQLLPQCTEAVFAPLQQFLQADGQLAERKRLQLAEQLADLFDAYQMYRADWLEDWAAGKDELRRALNRDERIAVPEPQTWQPALWRKLLEAMGPDNSRLSRAAIHKQTMHQLELGQWGNPLPRRVMVFGVSALPQQVLEALALLSEHCQVVLFVHNPCEQYWADLVEDKHLLATELAQRQRHLEAAHNQEDFFAAERERTHPLLAAWGKQGRDFIGLLYRHDHPESYQHLFENNQVDVFHHQSATTVLQHLQQDILTLTPPPSEPRQRATGDNSLHFAIGHGPQREVEILQDYLLGLFNREPDLAPRHVVVMVPNIETYAPYIEAVFGRTPRHDPRYLPFSIGDRSLGATLSMAQGLDTLLSLPSSRFSNTEILDLLTIPAVQARFELSPEDVNLLEHWVHAAGVRWGLSGEQRQSLQVPDFEQNTWLFGLRRMLAGYLVGDGELWQGIAPYGEVAGLDARLAGQLAHLLQKLNYYWQQLSAKHKPEAWGELFGRLLDDFFVPQEEGESTLNANLRRQLGLWQDACSDADFNEPVPLMVARIPLDDTLAKEGPSQRFLVGSISFCTLMPMRSIPFRHLCLLGMNDGEYPRQQDPLSFDLMRTQIDGTSLYRPGDRARRDDDRYLFLEALLSARDSLYISWTGRSQQDNTELPPSVLVSQLKDAIDAYWEAGTSAQLTVEHAVQPFSERYFVHSEDTLPATYAKEWFALHQAAEAAVESNDDVETAALLKTLSLETLSAFLRQPVAFFFSHRLGVYLRAQSRDEEDTEPFSFDGLATWQLENTLVNAALEGGADGYEHAMAQQVEWLRTAGELPVGEFADLLTHPKVLGIASTASRFFASIGNGNPTADKLLHLVRDATTVEGNLNHLYQHQHQLSRQRMVPGNINRRWDKLLQDWALHLVACAQGLSLSTYVYGQDAVAELAPVHQSEAQVWLDALIHGVATAMQQPLPIACQAAFTWLAEFHKTFNDDTPEEEAQEKARVAAQKAYENEGGFGGAPGELHRVPELKRIWPDFNALYSGHSTSGEGFIDWAKQLYGPLYASCEFHQGGQQ